MPQRWHLQSALRGAGKPLGSASLTNMTLARVACMSMWITLVTHLWPGAGLGAALTGTGNVNCRAGSLGSVIWLVLLIVCAALSATSAAGTWACAKIEGSEGPELRCCSTQWNVRNSVQYGIEGVPGMCRGCSSEEQAGNCECIRCHDAGGVPPQLRLQRQLLHQVQRHRHR